MLTKIAIIGLGGVGGYYGGLLSRFSENNPGLLEVTFIVRGSHLEKINEQGLKVITETGTFTTHPYRATAIAEEAGVMDYVILATKSYDLDAVASTLR